MLRATSSAYCWGMISEPHLSWFSDRTQMPGTDSRTCTAFNDGESSSNQAAKEWWTNRCTTRAGELLSLLCDCVLSCAISALAFSYGLTTSSGALQTSSNQTCEATLSSAVLLQLFEDHLSWVIETIPTCQALQVGSAQGLMTMTAVWPSSVCQKTRILPHVESILAVAPKVFRHGCQD